MVIGLLALVFIGFGIWTLVSPKGAVAFKASLLKPLGIQIRITPTPQAYRTLRYVGLATAILGFLLLFS